MPVFAVSFPRLRPHSCGGEGATRYPWDEGCPAACRSAGRRDCKLQPGQGVFVWPENALNDWTMPDVTERFLPGLWKSYKKCKNAGSPYFMKSNLLLIKMLLVTLQPEKYIFA